jgi:nitrous oxidase accessory protein NosD
VAQVGAAVVFVSATTVPSVESDGSSSRPFAGLQEALSRAPRGALLRLEPGTYQGPFVVPRPIVLSGAGSEKTRLTAPPDANAPVIASDGNALELRELTVEGSAMGIAVARTSLRLGNVLVRGQSQVALSAVGADVDIEGGAVSSIAAGRSGKGIVLEGGTLGMRGTVLREAGRRAIELHGTKASLTALDAAGSAVSILQALEGSEATVEGGSFQRTGGPALYGAASQLVVRGARISGAEYGVLVYRKGHLELRDTRIYDTAVAGVALVLSPVRPTSSDWRRTASASPARSGCTRPTPPSSRPTTSSKARSSMRRGISATPSSRWNPTSPSCETSSSGTRAAGRRS